MTTYATVAQLKIRIQLHATLTADQEVALEELLEASSRNIDRVCRVGENGFAVGSAADKYFPAEGESFLNILKCTNISNVAVKASVAATTYTDWATPTTPMAGDGDWIPCRGNPESPEFGVTPYDLLIIDLNGDYSIFIDGGSAPVVKVTAVWGTQASVPSDIREACLMQAAKWFKKYQGAQASELGLDQFGKIKYTRSMDSGVKQILLEGNWILPLYGGA